MDLAHVAGAVLRLAGRLGDGLFCGLPGGPAVAKS
jgi:alkanesulfonate monooxygenase SsuD/methylene tetrahydromethanopterin reductase-like flavin-dependent oxidoreductase (luciferase family)